MPHDHDHMNRMRARAAQARRVAAIERRIRELLEHGPLDTRDADRLTGVIQQGRQEQA